MADTIGVGLVGYKFMGKAHSNAFLKVNKFFKPKIKPVMRAICGRHEEEVINVQQNWGWETYETDWKKLIKRDDIHLVDISTPNDTHCEIAIEAAKAGKHILCEKPLAMNSEEAKKMVNAVKKAGVKHMICFNYRRVPAISLAKKIIDEGRIGRIYHIRAVYLQDWIINPEFPLVWRLDSRVAGSGSHGDLNAHLIDLTRFLAGDFDEVVGCSETFIKQRPVLSATTEGLSAKSSPKKGKVTVDDATLFLARFKNGALGSFEATRFAAGRKNGEKIEINGSEGSLVFEFERMNELKFYSRKDPSHIQGFRTILVTEPGIHPYIDGYWPPGHIIGYEHTFINTIYDLLNDIADNRMPSPNFEDGLKCQKVLDAVMQSVKEKKWIKI